jgi:hypothetical protein
MTCADIRDGIAIYFDLSEMDERRRLIDQHVHECQACRAEWRRWQETIQLIREQAHDSRLQIVRDGALTERVMTRIYEAEPWRRSALEANAKDRPRFRDRFKVVLVASLLPVIGLIVFALSGQLTLLEQAVAVPDEQATASIEGEIVAARLIPDNVYDEWLAIGGMMLGFLLLLLSWYNRFHNEKN